MFPPLKADHPAFGADCWLCSEPLGNEAPVQLLVLGPENEQDRLKHAEGGWYSAAAILLHGACVQGVQTHPGVAEAPG